MDFKPGFRDFNDFCLCWAILEEIFGHFRFLAKANCYSAFVPSAKADGNKVLQSLLPSVLAVVNKIARVFIAVSFS